MSQKPNLSVNTAQLRARLQQISSNSAKNSDGSERPTMRNRIGTKKIDEDALARVRQLASRVAKSKQENSTEKLPKTAESVELTSSHNISRDKTLPSGQKPSKNTNDSKSNSRRPSVENISKRVNNNISSRNPSDEDLTFREKGLPPPPGKDNVNDISRDKTLPSSRKVSKDDIRVKNNSRKASKDDNRIQPRSRKPSKDNNDDAGMNKLETAMKTLGTTREQSSKNVQELELEIIHLQETLDRRETRWKRDKANYQELLQKSKDENNRLIKDLESLRDQLDNTSEIDKLKQSLELAQENESLACAERDEMKTKYDFDTARLKKDIDELMDNVDSIELQKNAEIRDLTLQVQEMASKNGEYEIDLSKKSQIITELEEDLVKERQELENSKLEHRRELRTFDEEREKFRNDILKLENQLALERETIIELNIELKDVQDSAAEYKKQVHLANERLSTGSKDQLLNDTTLNTRNSKINYQSGDAIEKVDAMKKMISGLQDNVSVLESILSSNKPAASRTGDDTNIAELEAALKQARFEKGQLENSVRDFESIFSDYNQAITELEASLEAKEKEIEDLKSQLTSLKLPETDDEMFQFVQDMTNKLNDTRKEVSKLNEENSELKAEVLKLRPRTLLTPFTDVMNRTFFGGSDSAYASEAAPSTDGSNLNK